MVDCRTFRFPTVCTSALDALAASGRDLPACLPWVDAQTLREAARFTFSRGSLYRLTRGTHAAALFGREAEMVAMAEDIGRHNAVDKVIGLALLEDRPLENLFMTVTGRISSEMVGKLAHTQIPLVLSKSAPTDLALDLAVKVSLSVVGRATAKGFTVYTCPEMVGSPSGLARCSEVHLVLTLSLSFVHAAVSGFYERERCIGIGWVEGYTYTHRHYIGP